MRVQPKAPVQPEVLVEPEAPVEPEDPIQVAEEAIVESISSSETEFDQGHDMVTRETMTISHFVLGQLRSSNHPKAKIKLPILLLLLPAALGRDHAQQNKPSPAREMRLQGLPPGHRETLSSWNQQLRLG